MHFKSKEVVASSLSFIHEIDFNTHEGAVQTGPALTRYVQSLFSELQLLLDLVNEGEARAKDFVAFLDFAFFDLTSDPPTTTNFDPIKRARKEQVQQVHIHQHRSLFECLAPIMNYIQAILLACAFQSVSSLNIVIAGGTGKVGRLLSSSLHNENKGHKITVLCRNAFLASAPAKVSEAFGWLGESFLNKHDSIDLRDWDGGDLLDIVGCDWQGWQDDALPKADVIVNLVGGYTEQRTMACERLVRESLRLNPSAKHVLLSMADVDLKTTLKKNRAKECEDMITANCFDSVCLRAEMYDVKGANSQIMDVISQIVK